MIVTDNYIDKKGSIACGGPIARRAARSARVTRDSGSEPGIGRVREATEHLHHSRTDIGIEIL